MQASKYKGPVEILSESSDKERGSFEVQLALAEVYETMYGIFDHRQDAIVKQRPLALVAMHPKENATSFSPLYRRIDEFRRLRIFEMFGTPLDIFLNLPHDYVTYMIRLAEVATHQEGKQTDDLLKQMMSGDRHDKT